MNGFDHIVIAGVGSIGSFVAQSLATSLCLRKLTLVDHDIVEERNIGRSLFSKKHIGQNKAEVIKRILEPMSDVEIECIPYTFKYSYFKDQNIDLIVDSRDMLTSRDERTIKATISGENLIVDGRKNIPTKDLHGSYIIDVDNSTLMHVSNIILRMIKKGVINQLLRTNQLTYIPIHSSMENESIPVMPELEEDFTFEEETEDVVHDFTFTFDTKLSNPMNAIKDIEKVDKNHQVKLEIATVEDNFKYMIDVNSFQSPHLLLNFIDNILQELPNNSYIVIIEGNNITVTPEDGGA